MRRQRASRGDRPGARRAALAALLAVCCQAAAAAEAPSGRGSVDVSSCQAAYWRTLPMAKSDVPSKDYDPTDWSYYSDWVLNNVLPAFVLCCLSAALLAAFLLWRGARLAPCCSCLRGARLRGKPAADLLAARYMRWLRWAMVAMALGVVAGAGYGFSTISPGLEPQGVDVYDQTQAYVTECLGQANSTVGALGFLLGQSGFLKQRALDLNLTDKDPALVQTLEGFQADLRLAAAGIQSAVSDVQASVLGRMEELQQEWQPRLDRLDVVKNAALYAAYACIIGGALGLALGVALNCPGLAKGSLLFLLIMLLLAWAAVAASTAGLQVGANGCQVVEEKITTGLVAAAERQIRTGHGVLAIVGVGDSLGLARYYLYGQGKNATQVVADLTGLNIPMILGEANKTVTGLQQASGLLKGANSSVSTLPDDLAVLAAGIGQLSANVSLLEDALSYSRFHPVYMTVKEYGCCSLLNFVGGLWLGLLVVGCCGLPLTLAAFFWIARMDRLEPKGCCHVYRRADFAQQQQAGGTAATELPDKKPRRGGDSYDGSSDEEGLDLEGGPSLASRRSLPGSMSLREKFASAGLLRSSGAGPSGRGPAAGEEGAQAANAADTFRIRTAPYPAASAAASQHEGEEGEVPPSPPSAPLLPALGPFASLPAARTLNSRPSGGPAASGSHHTFGTWAAVAIASAPPTARGGGFSSRSAPGSALNTSRSSLANSARSTSGLLPAVEALSPGEQAAFELPVLAGEPAGPAGSVSNAGGATEDAAEVQQGSPLRQPAASNASVSSAAGGGGGSGSALRRAGQALGRLKLMRHK